MHGEPDTGSAYTQGQGGAEEDEVARVRPFDNAEQRNATLDVYYAIGLCVVYNTRGGVYYLNTMQRWKVKKVCTETDDR